jgi:hypothetical protein
MNVHEKLKLKFKFLKIDYKHTYICLIPTLQWVMKWCPCHIFFNIFTHLEYDLLLQTSFQMIGTL